VQKAQREKLRRKHAAELAAQPFWFPDFELPTDHSHFTSQMESTYSSRAVPPPRRV
jgi:hypothetical protein